MRRHSLATLVLAILAMPWAGPTSAQTVDDTGLWLAFFGQDDLGEPGSGWKWWYDGHLRFLDDADGFFQTIARPGIGRKLNDQTIAWMGYGWIYTTLPTAGEVEEHRIWPQLTWSASRDEWTIALRPRLELRFVDTGDELGWRFRQLVRLQHSLPNFPRLSFVAWDEIFFHLNDTDWGANDGFDQNRVFVGLGVQKKEASRFRTEIGYLNQSIYQPFSDNRSNHILSMNLYY